MDKISNLYRVCINKVFFEIKNNIISINLNKSNNYCLYFVKTKI